MSKRALIVVSSHSDLGSTGKKTGWYLSEVSHVYYPLVAAGYEVDIASPQGGAAPMDEASRNVEDSINRKFLDDSQVSAKLKDTLPIASVDPKKYRVIHFAGGHGVMWDFLDNADLNRVTAAIYEAGGVVAAVCHGPAALVNVMLSTGKYLLEGKQVNAFTNAEEEEVGLTKIVPFSLENKLKERGATFIGGRNGENKVIISERLVTGQNPNSASSLAKRLVEVAKAQPWA